MYIGGHFGSQLGFFPYFFIMLNPPIMQVANYTMEFFGLENIHLYTKTMFLNGLERKNWLCLWFSSHLGGHFGFFKNCNPQNHISTLIPENIYLDTKIIFLDGLERKIWLFCIFCILASILAAILDFSNFPRIHEGYPFFLIENISEKQNMQKKFILISVRGWPHFLLNYIVWHQWCSDHNHIYILSQRILLIGEQLHFIIYFNGLVIYFTWSLHRVLCIHIHFVL